MPMKIYFHESFIVISSIAVDPFIQKTLQSITMLAPQKERPKEPIETWIMCRADNATSRLADIAMTLSQNLGCSIHDIKDGFIGDVIIGDTLHKIRGRMEMLIYTEQTREHILEVLEHKDPGKRPPIRRVTEEELEAIAKLPPIDIGGMKLNGYQTEEDLRKKLAERPKKDEEKQ